MGLRAADIREHFPVQSDGTQITVNYVTIEGGTFVMVSPETLEKKPMGAITVFISAAMKQARIEFLEEEGIFYGEIPSCQGVWAMGKKNEECLDALQKVLEDWMLFKFRDGDKDFPLLGNANLNEDWQEERARGE
jgi:predicted RNase H-like HicB family nuclease